jgi:hypothetical protein
MKKTLLIVGTLATVVFGLTYQQKINQLQGLHDTIAVTPYDKIDYAIRAKSSEMMNGTLTKADIVDDTTNVTTSQFYRAASRGVHGNLTKMMVSFYIADPTINTVGMDAVADSTLDSIFINNVYYIARLIGAGML